ncbi:hypothetical protein, partial [Bifidobacterium magnum]|uniref:hypothetical protein n=1 Tax=Bifidobacterium magnum TaxID=1692 RepID=UPI000529EA6D
ALYKVIADRLKKDKEDYEEASAEIKSKDRNGWSPDANGVMQPNKSTYDDATSGGVGGVDRQMGM